MALFALLCISLLLANVRPAFRSVSLFYFLPNNSLQLDASTDFTRYDASGEGLASRASLAEDGRISVSFNLKRALPDLPKDYAQEVNVFAADTVNFSKPPRLNVVIMIVGSRGPFLSSS